MYLEILIAFYSEIFLRNTMLNKKTDLFITEILIGFDIKGGGEIHSAQLSRCYLTRKLFAHTYYHLSEYSLQRIVFGKHCFTT